MLQESGRALVLLLTGDAEVWRVTAVSLQVSLTALTLAALCGLPLGYRLALSKGRTAAVTSWLLHTLTALPTVVVGLGLYFVLSASGPLGWMDLLYTKAAMALGQFVLAWPIVTAVTLTAVRGLPREAIETAAALGLPPAGRARLLLNEVRAALTTGLLLGFSRVFTEVGAAVILGGNIRHHTRTLTTVIALEHTRGDDARAIAMGLILMMLALTVNGFVHGAALWRKTETI